MKEWNIKNVKNIEIIRNYISYIDCINVTKSISDKKGNPAFLMGNFIVISEFF